MSTSRGTFSFVVKENDRGHPFIVLEPGGGDLEIFKGGFLSFDLNADAQLADAEKFAATLNENIAAVGFTNLS